MKIFTSNKIPNRIFLFLSIISSSLLFVISHYYYSDYNEDILQAQSEVELNTQKSTTLVNKRLQKIKQMVDDLANDISISSKDSDILIEKIRKTMLIEPLLSEVGYCFRPYSVNNNIRLDGRSLRLHGNTIKEVDTDKVFDYTKQDVEWFHQALEKGSVWIAPCSDYKTQELIITYATTIYSKENSKPMGVLYMNLLVSRLQTMIHREIHTENGYIFILSKDHEVILHPKRDLAGKSFYSFYSFLDKEWIKSFQLESPLEHLGDLKKIRDPFTQKQAWIWFDNIDTTGWLLGTMNIVNTVSDKLQTWKKRLMKLWIIVYITLILISIYISTFFFSRKNKLIFFASQYSIVTFLALVAILTWFAIYPDFGIKDHKLITNHSSIHKFKKEQYKRALDNKETLPLFVPTGIYIQSVSFISSSNVSVKGYIWQKYYDGVHDNISQGFILPEALNYRITESYRRVFDGGVLVGWQFKVTINQYFNYKFYPFQGENIWIQLWHKDFSDNIILVPDLDSYKITSPHLKAGLLKGLGLADWKINSTFFSYKNHSYHTNFGIGNYSGLNDFPELYFNILIKKTIISPLISNLLPLSIILIMLFTVLLLSSKKEKEMSIFGYNTMAVIGICGGFFLVLIFAHIDLRKHINSSDIIYLEYYYFIAYFMLLFMSLNSLIFSKTENRLFDYDNLIIKVAFWPLALLFTFIITFITFYFGR